MNKLKIAFICIHNSCRSQIAEALARMILSHIAEIYSAGTDITRSINPTAVDLMMKIYNVDILKIQKPKLIAVLPNNIDYVISMGCDVSCPSVVGKTYIDWKIKDPTNLDEHEFIKVIEEIELKLHEFKNSLTLT